MKLLPLASFIILCLRPMTFAEDIRAEYQWENTPGGRLGAVLGDEPDRYLRIANTNSTALRVQLLKIEKPSISSQLYALSGEVRYENVQGDGFLEMWNIFAPAKAGGPEAQYFSRTLGPSGDMGKITGSSDWRRFTLTFNMAGASSKPSRLEVNLVLPGSGRVDLKGVKLIQFSDSSAGLGAVQPWWSNKQAGIIGGISGSLLGCLGGLLGTLAGRRKAQSFVIAAGKSLIALGAILAVVFVIALIRGQPYWVLSIPGIMALLLLSVLPAQLRRYRSAYTDAEMRRMVAEDSVA